MLGKEREKNLGSRKKDVNQNREGEILYQLSKCKRSQKTNQSMSNYQDNWNRSQVNEESAENGCC